MVGIAAVLACKAASVSCTFLASCNLIYSREESPTPGTERKAGVPLTAATFGILGGAKRS